MDDSAKLNMFTVISIEYVLQSNALFREKKS